MLRREDLVLKGNKKGLSNGQLFFSFFYKNNKKEYVKAQEQRRQSYSWLLSIIRCSSRCSNL
ncbi:hypothetical protein EMIT0180MI3_60001 [Priestia megaterium]